MRIGLLTDSGYPHADGETGLWCDRLLRGLSQHEFDLFALGRPAQQEGPGRGAPPPRSGRVRTAPPWTADGDVRPAGPRRWMPARFAADGGRFYRRGERRRFAAHMGALATAVCTAGSGTTAMDTAAVHTPAGEPVGSGAPGARTAGAGALFTEGLYGLAELARERGGLHAALRSEVTVRILESACRAPGAGRTVQSAAVPDILAVAAELGRLLLPLSFDWYEEDGLGAVDLCHAASGGAAALPGLLAKRFFGVPLLVTEHSVRLRAHYLATPETPLSAPVRALLANFHGQLAAEVYRQASVITSGNARARRWQERCGADAAKLRTVYPGMETERFGAVGESGDGSGPDTLVWVGRIEPAKDLVALLHSFAEVHRAEPGARLRVFGAPAQGGEDCAYLAHCRALAAQLFPDEATNAHAVGDNPVSFEEIGCPEVPDLAEAYAAGGVVVLSSVVEGFPISLVEAMFCGRATVSTDVGAVVEVIGGTGLVVPPRNPRALADVCIALLRDPARRARLGAAARSRALELFTVAQDLAAFRDIYLDMAAQVPARRNGTDRERSDSGPRPFATPPEALVPAARPPARSAAAGVPVTAGVSRVPGWAAGAGERDA